MAKRQSRAKAEQRPGSESPVEVPNTQNGKAADMQRPPVYTEDDVRRRAYELYRSRNGKSDPLSDWLDAERELRDLSAN